MATQELISNPKGGEKKGAAPQREGGSKKIQLKEELRQLPYRDQVRKIQFSGRGKKAIQMKDEKEVEQQVQNEIVIGMSKANTEGDVRYPWISVEGKEHPLGYLDPDYWEQLKQGSELVPWTFNLRKGKSASDGMDAVFKGPTRLECLSMAKAVYWRSIKETLGREKFDNRYGENGKDNQNLTISASAPSQIDPLLKHETIEQSGLKKGDWCYFHNHWKYLRKHPDGAFQGENAIYMGKEGAGEDTWTGFGAHNKTTNSMMDTLKMAYDQSRTSKDEERINEMKESLGSNLRKAGKGEEEVKKGQQILEDHYKDYPETVPPKEIPGLDEGGGMERMINMEIGDLDLRINLIKSLFPEDRSTVQMLEFQKKRYDRQKAQAGKFKGKVSTTRLDTKQIAAMTE
ncbi:MAG: hypothetical protein FJ088_04400 [Deltaproteobacteria bacterium]|nr:hypothetical protein [Deltaproteobacteria bacterium]